MATVMGYIGYSRSGNYDEQEEMITGYAISMGIILNNVYIDTSKENKQYKEMMDNVNSGDIIIVSSINSLNENSQTKCIQMAAEIFSHGVALCVLDIHVDTSKNKEIVSVIKSISKIYNIETDIKRMEGIEHAKSMGKYKGRKPKDIQYLEEYAKQCEEGTISLSEVCRRLGISRSTFYRRINNKVDNKKNK